MSVDWRSDGALWAALPVPAFLTDASGTLRHANPAAEAFLTLSARSLSGTPLDRHIAADEPLGPAIGRALAGRAEVVLGDAEIRVRDRPAGRADIHVAPVEEGALILVIPRDIAARAAGPASRGGRSAIGMAEMLAHEIKNPLAGISGAAQLLSMNLSNGDREMTDLIVAETRRVATLLEQVEAFGATPPPRRRAVNVHDLLDRARRSAAMGHAAHMHFREEYDPSLPPTWADPDQLVQVLLNLLKNAAEAQPPGAGRKPGTITLRTHYEAGLRVRRADGGAASLPLQVEVVDDGPGVPDAIREHAFEPFVSGRENGTGLGLALAGKIMADHGGWITLESRPGRTAFRLSLPIAPTDLTEEG
ncbi:MAG: two-component system sensor histidine kinase NtrB [Hasllibacter sp.]